MIDMHCHILPGVDDGAKDLYDSIEMARIAQLDGIKTIINTSHFHPEFEYKMGQELEEEVIKFNELLKEYNIDVQVLLGNELYYSDNLLEYIEDKKFYTLNNSRYLLLEFAPTAYPKQLANIIYELKIKGYVPILAHVERYKEVQKDINTIKDAIEEGALIQINASSLTGKAPQRLKDVSDKLLKYNMVHFVGSDAHGSTRRRPMLKEAYEYILQNYGGDLADALFEANPNKVINDKEIDVQVKEIKQVKEKKGLLSKIFGKKDKV